MDDKSKSGNEHAHRVLDDTLNELHKAMHICLDAVSDVENARAFTDTSQMDVIQQTNAIIDVMVNQMRMVIFTPLMHESLKQHEARKANMRAIEYREFLQKNNLLNLQPLLEREELRTAHASTDAAGG